MELQTIGAANRAPYPFLSFVMPFTHRSDQTEIQVIISNHMQNFRSLWITHDLYRLCAIILPTHIYPYISAMFRNTAPRLLNISSFFSYPHLKQTLTTLHLEENNIDDKAVHHIASALQVNTVTPKLLHIKSLVCYLPLPQTLTTLHLDVNPIGTEGAQHLASALRVNTVRAHSTTCRYFSAIFV